MIETDILVAGGGIAGLSATARLGAAGFDVICIDPAPADQPGNDLRTTAFLQPAIDTLDRAGAWDAMAHGAAALWTMRLVDAGGAERAPRETADFEAGELMDRPFGWNVPNTTARAALLDRFEEFPNARLIDRDRVTSLVTRRTEALARLESGEAVRAKLVVAADGRGSRLREAAGIRAHRWHYGQKALVFAVGMGRPHDGVSTEIHRTGGPVTFVPMPDGDGGPCASVVWMVPGARAAALAELDDRMLAAELEMEAMGLFGRLEIAGPKAVWPIIAQVAARLTGERLALVAEAAHVVPPIGAQGLNMSLTDIECLAGLAEEARGAGRDIGGPDLLDTFQRRRHPEMLARVAGIDLLNRAAQAKAQPLRDLRRAGLRAIHQAAPVRHLAIKLGLGVRS